MFLILGTLLATSVFTFILLFSLFIFVAKATFQLPDLEDQKLFTKAQTSKIYDANGGLITDFYVEQNRVVVPLEKISENLQNAVIAIEDKRFYKHEGVDWKAILRALVRDVRSGKIVEGGSTLTQQYVKNTLGSPEQTIDRKIREATLAFQIEAKLSKKQILEGYLNTIFFGQSAYGAEAAAQTFFAKSSSDLTVAEAAMIAGVIRSPNAYSPYVDIELAKKRRDLVVKNMLEQKFISVDEASEATNTPLEVQPQKTKSYPFPYFVEFVKQRILKDSKFGSTASDRANALFKGGLRIYTTVDPDMQRIAYDSVWSTLDRPEDPVGSLVAIEPKTGHIKAMVGGKDWETQKLNLASQGFRQPGSSFKPFVLAAALTEGMSISQTYRADPAVIKLPTMNWVVNNSGRSGGMMTLHDATVYSVNAVFARLIMDVGPNKVAELSRKMGIDSPVESLPAIALGGLGHGVSALDMATAFSTFANKGEHAKPIAITKITDADGNILKENQTKTQLAIDPVVAYLVTDALKDVIRFGTGRRAGINRVAAGKTGTAEDYGDAWFVGYTPNISTAVWIGYRDSNRWMTNVHGITVQGGSLPADIWRKFMSRALVNYPATNFERPARGIFGQKVCADMSGYMANEFCPEEETRWATFATGAGPKRRCDRHQAPPNIKIPNVIGLSAEEARAALEAVGLTGNVTDIDRFGIPAGQVAGQTPGEGEEIPEGSAVEIEVSTGRDPTVRLSGVVGLPKEQAQSYLEDAGLKVKFEQVKAGNKNRIGIVISQKPKTGSVVPTGSTVTLKIGK